MLTEKEYIDVGDLKTVIASLSVLRDICPENSSVIDVGEYREVYGIIRSWRESLFELINIEPEDE